MYVCGGFLHIINGHIMTGHAFDVQISNTSCTTNWSSYYYYGIYRVIIDDWEARLIRLKDR